MTRWKAASIHLCISAVIGVAAAVLIFGVWYPAPYAHAAGADELVLLLVGADLVLGPLMTLIVFKPGKRWLKLDLGIIGLLQAAALAYGIHVVVETRPVFLVAVIDQFILVSANEIAPADLAEGSSPEFRSLSWSGLKLAGAVLPTKPEERNRLISEASAGKDLQNLPRTYVPYESISQSFAAKAKDLDTLDEAHPEVKDDVAAWLRHESRSAAGTAWVPVVARKGLLAMLIDRASGATLKAFAVDGVPDTL